MLTVWLRLKLRQGLAMLGRLLGLEELAVNSDDVDRRAAFPLCGKRFVSLPCSWSNLKQVHPDAPPHHSLSSEVTSLPTAARTQACPPDS